jgi:hypothetical protein
MLASANSDDDDVSPASSRSASASRTVPVRAITLASGKRFEAPCSRAM